MKKHSSISFRQLLFGLGFLLAFSGMVFLLFFHRRDEKRFTNITGELFLEEMRSNTLSMHYTLANPENFGIHDYSPVLSCYDAGRALRGQAETENLLSSLKSLHSEKLSKDDANLLQLLVRSLENSLALSSYPYYGEPLSPVSGTQTNLPILLAEYTFRTRRDVEDYLALLDQTDEYLASLLVYEQEKAAAGFIMPAPFLREVRRQCDTIVTKEALESDTHFLQTTFRERLDSLLQENTITAQEASLYLSQNDRLLKTVLLPAYSALGDGLLLLEDESVVPAGLASLPEGKAYYELLLISETGSYRPVEEILEMLKNRFSAEFGEIKKLTENNPELVRSLTLDTTKDFPYKNASQMLLDLQERIKEDFPSLPGSATSIAVKAVSQNLEDYCAPAFYLTAPLDDTDTNSIYINRQKTPEGLELYTTLAHEGWPGHLYQAVYENSCGFDPVRKLYHCGGYVEGWATYVEWLSYAYAIPDPQIAELLSANGAISLGLHARADVGIHYEGWSLADTEAFFAGYGVTDPHTVAQIYQAVLQDPGNYLKYYLGATEILKLKEQAYAALSDDFVLKDFHTFFLSVGPAPFPVIEDSMEEWLRAKTARTAAEAAASLPGRGA